MGVRIVLSLLRRLGRLSTGAYAVVFICTVTAGVFHTHLAHGSTLTQKQVELADNLGFFAYAGSHCDLEISEKDVHNFVVLIGWKFGIPDASLFEHLLANRDRFEQLGYLAFSNPLDKRRRCKQILQTRQGLREIEAQLERWGRQY